MNKIIKEKSGFSIMEATVALSIITFGMLGILSLVTQNVKADMVSKNFLVASMLAQEGLELVRNLRDENWQRSGSSWDDDLVWDGTYLIDHYGRSDIDDSVDSIGSASPDEAARLYIDPLNLYSHFGSGTTTPFFRLISVVESGTNDMISASSTVRWQDSTGWHDYVAETKLYDWR